MNSITKQKYLITFYFNISVYQLTNIIFDTVINPRNRYYLVLCYGKCYTYIQNVIKTIIYKYKINNR